jgi:hypothetical protein
VRIRCFHKDRRLRSELREENRLAVFQTHNELVRGCLPMDVCARALNLDCCWIRVVLNRC